MKKKIFLVVNLDKVPELEYSESSLPLSETEIGKLLTTLEEKCDVVGKFGKSLHVYKPVGLSKSDAELVFVFGGDGSILSVGRYMNSNQIPIVGINLGKLGYLATFTIEEVTKHLDYILGNVEVEKRLILAVENRGKQTPWSSIAVNDLVLDIGSPFRTSEIAVSICPLGSGRWENLSTIRGDGIIVSTSTGSTAYNMSCMGPIVQPGVESMILTPKNPHRLSIRPIVVCPSSRIRIEVLETEGMYAIIDGQSPRKVRTGDCLTIERHFSDLQMVQNPEQGYFTTLTEKLNWGK